MSMNTSPSTYEASDLQSLFVFAEEVFDHVRTDALIIFQEKGMKSFLGSLVTFLSHIGHMLGELDASLVTHQRITGLLTVLDNLERLCQWPIAFERLRDDLSEFDPSWYPSLHTLLVDDGSAQANIRELGKEATNEAARFRIELRRSLSKFQNPEQVTKRIGISKILGSVKVEEPPDDHAHIQTLYMALSTYCLCRCSQFSRPTVTSLRLNWSHAETYSETEAETKTIAFGLLFRDYHSVDVPYSLCRWQDTQMVVLRKRRLKFVDDPQGLISGTDRTIRPEPEIPFCTHISRNTQAQLRFIVSDTGITYQETIQPSKAFLTDLGSISLATLITSHRLRQKTKSLLSFLLAKCFWQFYHSHWLKDGWTKEDIHFMSEVSDGIQQSSTVICINEPFLRSEFEAASVNEASDTTQIASTCAAHSHKYPKILRLGILLLEIELGRPIESFRTSDSHDLDDISTLHTVAYKVLNDAALWESSEVFKYMEDVIRKCITPDFGQLSTEEEVRHSLYESVVTVIEQWFKKSWGHIGSVKTMSTQPFTTPQSSATLHNDDSPTANNSFHNRSAVLNQVVEQNVAGNLNFNVWYSSR